MIEDYIIALKECRQVINWYMENSTIPIHLVETECNSVCNVLDLIDRLAPNDNRQIDLGKLPF